MPRQRTTRQQLALEQLLAASTDFRSAQDLHAQLRAGGARVGLTTVYANLRGLAESGAVDTLRTDGGETLFRRCESGDHHHHLVCRQCGRTVEVAGPAVERWADQVARTEGFVDVRHTVEIVGTCAGCAKPKNG
ncbi:MAG TPA: Fur family transcriptional regulator [Candidatus Dormibacteraeota bacterium]|jgi:Fur family ferric uptake transcriptional regulator|nr:Fur family transcriptional regulator [Candidatus Dormibacteraeota bacterium]